ncbi:MAG: phosphocholine cytidylyltransferase family protein [Deferribacterota bacterium]|nr:phosphocholine cytidylyltransferase family protein [Deferribacterota bacterium]
MRSITKAILLSAGQGKRLSPLTKDRPKCLIKINNITIIEHQINALNKSGIKDIIIVTGFKSVTVENYVNSIYGNLDLNIKFCYNPFYQVSDNLATCWITREEFNSDFLIINGDDIFESSLIEKLLSTNLSYITVAVNIKNKYDEDDMKVISDTKNNKLIEVGKHIDHNRANGEAIGIHLFRGKGTKLFKETVEKLMRDPSGLKKWYLSAIDMLAKKDIVSIYNVSDYKWCEIDFPTDLNKAEELVKKIESSTHDKYEKYKRSTEDKGN